MLVNINGLKKNVENGLTILQACESQGVTIPHFCYHDKLSIAGNCRMCLIEESKSLKPLASCAVNITSSMQIFTNTELVKKAREGVLEFLLANHPLDCPICDQGGECDLQDQSLVFGGDRGRFYEEKRAVEDKNCGPLIKTIMTRCIHCTRCVRFASEVAGVSSLGVTGRGSSMEIGFYIEKMLNSEISGNIIDLCPVGALTSKPFAFTARSWELQSFESFDFFDAFGSNIRVDVRGTTVMRILPKVNSGLNEDWISDKIRFVYDALKYQRLTNPLIKQDGVFVKASWEKAFSLIKEALFKNWPFVGISGPFSDLEALYSLKTLLNKLGSSAMFMNNREISLNSSLASLYKFNFSMEDLESSDLCLIVGSNIRLEAPILNVKLRKLFLKGTDVFSIGPNTKTNYFIKNLGVNLKVLLQILEGNHWFSARIKKAKRPIVIIGSSFFSLKNSEKIVPWLKKIFSRGSFCGLGVLPLTSSAINAAELGFCRGIHSPKSLLLSKKFVYMLGSTKDNFSNECFNKNDFIVYQGSHGDEFIKNASIILPVATPFEKSSTFINVFGTIQKTKPVFFGINNVKADSVVINNLMSYLFDEKISLSLGNFLPYISSKKSSLSTLNLSYEEFAFVQNSAMSSMIHNFYKTDSFSSASKTMALCSKAFDDSKKTFV